jgi:hypothetical protein
VGHASIVITSGRGRDALQHRLHVLDIRRLLLTPTATITCWSLLTASWHFSPCGYDSPDCMKWLSGTVKLRWVLLVVAP